MIVLRTDGSGLVALVAAVSSSISGADTEFALSAFPISMLPDLPQPVLCADAVSLAMTPHGAAPSFPVCLVAGGLAGASVLFIRSCEGLSGDPAVVGPFSTLHTRITSSGESAFVYCRVFSTAADQIHVLLVSASLEVYALKATVAALGQGSVALPPGSRTCQLSVRPVGAELEREGDGWVVRIVTATGKAVCVALN
jgi:hypothetical protein